MKDGILVIGGTGMVGSSLVGLLRENKLNYRVLARSTSVSET